MFNLIHTLSAQEQTHFFHIIFSEKPIMILQSTDRDVTECLNCMNKGAIAEQFQECAAHCHGWSPQ